MDNIEFYQLAIKDLGQIDKYLGANEDVMYVKQLLIEQPEKVKELFTIRKSMLTEKDKKHIYIQTRYFEELPLDDRATLFAITSEISEENWQFHFNKRFDLYKVDHPIFQAEPLLFNELRTTRTGAIDYELIQLNNLKPYFLNGDKICKYNNTYYEIDGTLPSEILSSCLNKYSKNQIYIRINPHKVLNRHPGIDLYEELKRPPNPYWIEHMTLFKGKYEGCEFILEDNIEITDKITKQKYWERNISKIIRLEVVAHRRKDNFSMMLEELSEEFLQHGFLVGRCIHLDSEQPFGTHFDSVKLNHLDLAYQVYSGDSIKERKSQSLANGTAVADASKRVHLMRIDNIMLSDLLDIAQMFFKSKYLTKEWIENQFKFKNKSN